MFENLPADRLEKLATHYGAGETLCEQNDDTMAMFVLVKGKVEIVRDGQTLTYLEKPGTIMGEMSALLGSTRTSSIRTVTPVQVVVIDNMESFFIKHPTTALTLAKTIAERLLEADNRMMEALEKLKEQGSGSAIKPDYNQHLKSVLKSWNSNTNT